MRKLTIKTFAYLYNRDHFAGSGVMPDHLDNRWNGFNGWYYHEVWDNLNGDNDEYLFDDWCDTFIEAQSNSSKLLDNLSSSRLNKLYNFSWRMLTHYLWVSFKAGVFGILIDCAYAIYLQLKKV